MENKLGIADLLEILTIKKFNKDFNDNFFNPPEINENSRLEKLKINNFNLSKCRNFYERGDYKFHESYLQTQSERYFDFLLDEESYTKEKYLKVYELLKANATPHQKYLNLEYSHSYLDDTKIKIDSPSFHIHLEMKNPNFNCLADTKKEVLKEFRTQFKQYFA